MLWAPKSFPILCCQIPELDLAWSVSSLLAVSVRTLPELWLFPGYNETKKDGASSLRTQGHDRCLRRHWQTRWRSSQDRWSSKLQEGEFEYWETRPWYLLCHSVLISPGELLFFVFFKFNLTASFLDTISSVKVVGPSSWGWASIPPYYYFLLSVVAWIPHLRYRSDIYRWIWKVPRARPQKVRRWETRLLGQPQVESLHTFFMVN